MLSVVLIGTMASKNETPPPTRGVTLDNILEVITNMSWIMEVMDGLASTIQGGVSAMDSRMINVDG